MPAWIPLFQGAGRNWVSQPGVIFVTNRRKAACDQRMARRVSDLRGDYPNPMEHTMMINAKAVETDRELALEELDAISGGAIFAQTCVHALNPQPLPPGLIGIYPLNPQPLPP
jgi:hypothetical protein